MSTVIAINTCRVADNGHRSMVVKGTTYDTSDTVVQSNPWLFVSPEEYSQQEARPQSTADLGSRSMSSRKVETTRKAPGDKRDLDHVCDVCGETAKTRAGLSAHKRKHA